MKPFLALSVCTRLTACAANAPVVQTETRYDPATQARVRLYGQNQKPARLVSGIDCEHNRRGTAVSVGRSLGDAFSSFAGTAQSSSIGIPETEISRHISERNGLMSRAVFREYVVAAGKPANVQSSYIGLTHSNRPANPMAESYLVMKEGSCHSQLASFVPQAGRDYEVVGATGRACGVAVFEVAADGSTQAVALQDAFRCRRR
ncbi:hypothetical protein [Neisseria shayeganii]|uniref:Secreted protein n=1 Tax=Neisseria shayeganii TaxID=607712 RepID=A0A7D7S431_9NEIS|nr:hypothetical protein [Neisseria shayeganii]QMT39606.1 hypothetical protein H3L94_06885 [Neisseria shayeganii]